MRRPPTTGPPWQDYYDQRSAVERVNSRLAGRVRACGHPRAGEDAVARHHGADDHAGAGLGAHPGRPAWSTCGVWSDPPERRPRAAHHQKPNPTGSAARPVCAALSAEPRMRLDSSSLASSSTLDRAATPRQCAPARPSAPRPHLSAPPFVQRPQNPVQRNFLDQDRGLTCPRGVISIVVEALRPLRRFIAFFVS